MPVPPVAGGAALAANLLIAATLRRIAPAPRVAFVHQLAKELVVVFASFKVAAAAQQQRLFDHRFQMSMRRFDVSIMGVGHIQTS